MAFVSLSVGKCALQDITKHRFFNTNNLWVRLDMLAKMLMEFKGLLPLPLIKNSKTVDPKDGKSSKVNRQPNWLYCYERGVFTRKLVQGFRYLYLTS